ncbi:MAG: CHASE2 domain-containing protein [Cyclobacteriaceae bacterium]|nr:CHASE2 domain-containing protein [Cyclobacteriaceae bacterium]
MDNIFGTVFIFALMGLIFGVAQFKVFDMFDPIGQALDDMELTDVVYSQLREDPLPDSNIVIVNLGLLPRGLIGKQIEIISKYNPKVIGMDSFFVDEHLDDPEGDSILSHAIANAKNFVMVTKLLQSDSLYYVAEGEELYDSLERSHPKFRQNAYEAYANLETEAASQEDFKACRNMPPARKMLNGETEVAFAVKMAELYDKEKAEKYLARNNDWEVINYQGNVVDYFGRTDYPNYFYVLDWMDVLDENFVPGMIKDKIVIFGYHGKNLLDTSWDDKFFTPLNKKFAGKANPDMYGVAVHANIVSNILKEDYIETLSEEKGIVLAVLICFLNVMLFSMIYRRLPRWYDGLTKLVQLLEILILMFLMVMIFHWFDLKVNLTYTIAAVALAGDSLEVYYGVIKNLFNKESRRQLFTIDRK